MTRIGLTLALIVAAAPAPARDLFVDHLSGYTVEAEILNAPNCAGPVFDLPGLENFEKGICVFHRPARSTEDTERAISLLDQAQIGGLPAVHQQFATLLTGLAHCGLADRHLEAYRASGNQDSLSRALMCRDRRRAQAELNAIRWNHALFEYGEGLTPELSLNARLTEMSACQAGVLNADFDAECGLLTDLSEAEINAFVDEAVDVVIERYFAGVESPITAMFSRKLGRAEGLLESARGNIDALAGEAEDVNGQYAAFNTAYEDARDSKMAPIYEAYREAILRATSILDEFDRWKDGLFINALNVNLLPKIVERSGELEEELARVEELGFRTTAEALTGDVRRIINSDAELRAAQAQLCRVYFCELTSRRAIPNTIRACRRPSLAGNPLCVGTDGTLRDGALSVDFDGPQSVSVEDLCRGAGLDPAFTVLDMSPATSATCLGALP